MTGAWKATSPVTPDAMGSPLRAFIRIATYLLITGLLLPVQWIALKTRLPLARRLPLVYHRICSAILGFKIRVHGRAEAKGPVLFVCNHTSYTDIAILGALLPASFVAKAEVADWPFFGALAKLQRTVFVEDRKSVV